MKLLRILLEMSQSESLAQDYIRYAKDGLSGAEAMIDAHQIRLWQETDEDEEPDKYYIIKDDVKPATWKALVAALKKAGVVSKPDEDMFPTEGEYTYNPDTAEFVLVKRKRAVAKKRRYKSKK